MDDTSMFEVKSLKDWVFKHRVAILVILTLVLAYLSYSLYFTMTAPVANIDPPCAEGVSNGTLYISSSPYLPEGPFSDADALLFLTTSEFHAYGGVCMFHAIGEGDTAEIGHSTFKYKGSTLEVEGEELEPGLRKTNYVPSILYLLFDVWHYHSSTIEIDRIETAERYEVKTHVFGAADIPKKGEFENEVLVITGFESNRAHFNPITLVLYLLTIGFYVWLWGTVLRDVTDDAIG